MKERMKYDFARNNQYCEEKNIVLFEDIVFGTNWSRGKG